MALFALKNPDLHQAFCPTNRDAHALQPSKLENAMRSLDIQLTTKTALLQSASLAKGNFLNPWKLMKNDETIWNLQYQAFWRFNMTY